MACDDKKRIVMKQGNGIATIPVSSDHRDNSWLATDIYIGEFYLDLDTSLWYTRVGGSIVTVIESVFGNSHTDDTDTDGASTNSTLGYAGEDPETVLYQLGVSDLPAARYKFSITATWQNSSGVQRGMLGFYVDDVLVQPVVIRERQDSEDQHKYCDFAFVTFGALSSFNIELRGAVSAAGNTLSIVSVTTEYYRVS